MIPRTTSYEECFMARSTSSLAGKYLKCGEGQFDGNLRLVNENSLVDPRVSNTSPSETRLASRYFPTQSRRLTRELERTEILEWISTVPYTNHHKHQ